MMASTDAVNSMMDRVRDIAVLPQIVFKVVDLTGSTESSAREMESVIIVDPGFSAKLLTMANSAYYGLPRKVTSIREAITFLGFRAVRQLAMTVGVFDLFVGKNDAESLRRRAWWRHSVDSAICAKWLSTKCAAINAEEAYTCALLHYVGKTILDRCEPLAYEVVQAAVGSGADIRAAETSAYGCDHIEIATAAARKWGFPEILTEGLNYIDEHAPGSPFSEIKASTCFAHHTAAYTIRGKRGQDAAQELEIPPWAIRALGLDDSNMESLLYEGGAAIRSAALIQI